MQYLHQNADIPDRSNAVSPVFDEQIFGALADELGWTDAITVLSIFIKDTRGKLDRSPAYVADRMMAKREAHSIKSSAGTLGFLKLSNVARAVERDGDRLSEVEFRRLLATLHATFDETVRSAQTSLAMITKEAAP